MCVCVGGGGGGVEGLGMLTLLIMRLLSSKAQGSKDILKTP